MGIYTFEVTGSGEFPINMLSRGMWPATKECASNILGAGKRTILMKSNTLPNKSVWSSFGWRCVHSYCEERDDLTKYHTWPC